MRFRILPVLVLVAFLALAIRIGEFSMGVSSGGFASAQSEVNEEMPPMPSETAGDAGGEELAMSEAATEGEAEGEETTGPAMPDMEDAEQVEWKDATESEYEYSPVREELYEDLAERREGLQQRERQLATREAILEAAERELDQKLRELTAVRDEISALLERQSEEELARINSLVKIYEGMKAKDAANIFNTLDIDVLMAVMSRMSERKSAPIMAEMNPERARTVTILLAQQKQIPSIPPQ